MNKPIVYCINTCSTCKKAFKWLDEHNIEYDKINIYENPPSKEELLDFFNRSDLPTRRFFNTSGMVYREMHLKDKVDKLNNEEKANLLSSNGRLIKRPLLVTENKVIPGFKQETWEEALNINE